MRQRVGCDVVQTIQSGRRACNSMGGRCGKSRRTSQPDACGSEACSPVRGRARWHERSGLPDHNKMLKARCSMASAQGSDVKPQVGRGSVQKEIVAAADRIEACHQKFMLRRRRKTSQRFRRCSASREPLVSDPDAHGSHPTREAATSCGLSICRRLSLLSLAHSVRGAHSWGGGSYSDHT